MINKTKGIVLRTIKYGETSVIAKVFTELFGVQSYIVNGVRKAKNSRAHYFQPASLLELEVYHSDLKNLQRIKELRWGTVYRSVLDNVIKNAIALYMVEMLYKCLKEPEEQPALFEFCEKSLLFLDGKKQEEVANLPLYFSIHLPAFFGFAIQKNFSAHWKFFDPAEGNFTDEPSALVEKDEITARLIFEFLQLQILDGIDAIRMNRIQRQKLLGAMQTFYNYHFPDFGTMNTLAVMQAIF